MQGGGGGGGCMGVRRGGGLDIIMVFIWCVRWW